VNFGVVDLAAADPERLPDASRRHTEIHGIKLPRLAVAAGIEPLPAVLTFITSSPEGWVG